MFFLANKIIYPVVAIFGFSAFAVPKLAPWYLFATLILAVLLVVTNVGKKTRFVVLLLSSCLFLFVASGALSSSLSMALMSAITLAPRNRILAASILMIQTSYVSSLEALTGNFLHDFHIEAAAPSIICVVVVLLTQSRVSLFRVLVGFMVLPIAYIGFTYGLTSNVLMLVSFMPVCILMLTSTFEAQPSNIEGVGVWILLGLLALFAMGWIQTPPKTITGRYVVLPSAVDNPEARFYSNYQEALDFSGLNLTLTDSIEAIPSGSMVVLPWLTSSSRDGSMLPIRIRELAKNRGWTVVLVGEHTNMGESADFVTDVAGGELLRNDLSVPPYNTDNSGHLRSADIRAWDPSAIFNRGASVEIKSLLNRVLLSGDGWWAEQDIGEWLWLGDYLLQPNDRNGRLVLAASFDEGAARWVIVGDTSPFLNEQLIADPRAVQRILELVTHWPLFVRDFCIAIVAVSILTGFSILAFSLASSVLLVGGGVLNNPLSDDSWRLLWANMSGFDDRNFNQKLAKSTYLLSGDWTLIKPNEYLKVSYDLPKKPTVLFGLVKNKTQIEGVQIGTCRRIGSLKVSKGPYLMDSQVCKVHGPAKILLGDENEAAILQVGEADSRMVLILDRNFISRNAPIENVEWLEKKLKETF